MIRCVARKPSEPFGISNVHIRKIFWTDKPMCYEDILDQWKQKETKKKKKIYTCIQNSEIWGTDKIEFGLKNIIFISEVQVAINNFPNLSYAKPFQYDWSWEKYGFKWVCPGTATLDCSISFEWFRIQYLVLKPEFFIEAKGSSFHTFRQNALAEPSVQLPHFRSV